MTEPLLVDTSAAVALVVADHTAHSDVLDAIGDRVLGLAGHAAFETYSVLTRLPPPARRSTAEVLQLIQAGFPETRQLPESAAAHLVDEFALLGIAGGAVYDALVAATARAHDLQLATRDERAVDTYRAIGVSILSIR